jgi:hypothetical protein
VLGRVGKVFNRKYIKQEKQQQQKTFYFRTKNLMLPSIKFQNGAQIQDGRLNVFIV